MRPSRGNRTRYMYVPNLINFSKPIYRCIEEEEAMSLSVFFYCNCAFF